MNSHLERSSHRYATGLIGCIAWLFSLVAAANTQQQWRFSVFLDDKPIGYHNFTLTGDGADRQLTTRANFDVTFFKIPLFKYRHANVEHWSNQCLKSIVSTTDENGKLYRLEGSLTEEAFKLSSNTGATTLPACISTFAYWDKSFLERERLLNSQTGEYQQVEVDYLGEKYISVGDERIPAHHYKLTASDLDIDLWYSRSDEWLGLQSTTSSGRMLRYVVD